MLTKVSMFTFWIVIVIIEIVKPPHGVLIKIYN